VVASNLSHFTPIMLNVVLVWLYLVLVVVHVLLTIERIPAILKIGLQLRQRDRRPEFQPLSGAPQSVTSKPNYPKMKSSAALYA
jgi:hypothetical protein